MDDRCYFGCGGPIRHTLLELPAPYSGAPNLCEDHSKSWRALNDGGARRWPEDFWPWADKERKAMEEAKASVRQVEDRAPGVEILAEEAVVGAWYIVLSGETERCVARRTRGRGIQVGFVSVFDPGNDPDDIRWLPGRTKVVVEDEIEAAKLLASLAEDGKLPNVAGDLAFGDCPRNGLLCSVCEAPQRVTPSGPGCENGHGGAEGVDPIKVADKLGEQGYTEEAQAILHSVPFSARIMSGEILTPSPEIIEKLKGHSFTAMPGEITTNLSQVAQLGEAVGLVPEEVLLGAAKKAQTAVAEIQAASAENGVAKLSDEEIDAEISEARAARKGAGPTTIFHKSLHIDHRTPRELFEAEVKRWGRFYLDCAATEENKLCEYALTPEIDALSVDWAGTEEMYLQHGRNRWLNHPYSPGEEACPGDRSLCTKKKCVERGYHIDQRIASSGEWITYARDQVLKDGIPTDVLTKAAIDTNWWRDAIRIQPPEAGAYLTGAVDPLGGPAAEYLNTTRYKAGMWFRLTWERLVVEVTEIEGRVAFKREGNKGGAGFASALVMFYRPGHVFRE